MFIRSDLKALAKGQIKGNIGILFVCSLLIFLITTAISGIISSVIGISSAISMISSGVLGSYGGQELVMGYGYDSVFSGLLGMFSLQSSAISTLQQIFLSNVFLMSMVMIYLNLTKAVRPMVGDIFGGFRNYIKVVVLYLLMGIFTFLWSLLFIVPGIIKGISYSMAPYILAENPEMSALEAINESKRITKGFKGQLFVLELSFILWGLLTVVTFGIAAIYVAPYVSATNANAYLFLKGQGQSGKMGI